ncbi:hypothetical protein M0812_10467 [Anaeramoeba flamelloides]|uniref:Uncharacterized protein n=1 Tax=Anaeramoeba flamelloides TaxID=1746091 RepID=A0AAV7ZXI7_9EUKA|nr:hypothetical protein M0812_10467 [Anaeramoeba flamelloides]
MSILQNIWKNTILVDLKLTSNNNQAIHCHSLIFKLRFPNVKLEKIIHVIQQCNDNEINIFLDWCYSGFIQEKNPGNTIDISNIIEEVNVSWETSLNGTKFVAVTQSIPYSSSVGNSNSVNNIEKRKNSLNNYQFLKELLVTKIGISENDFIKKLDKPGLINDLKILYFDETSKDFSFIINKKVSKYTN